MKKKIIALLMVMVLAMTALAGCGDKKDGKSSGTKEGTVSAEDSSFFKEFGELAELKAGSEKVHLNYVIKSEEFANQEVLKDFLDADGNLAIDLTADVVTESESKVAVDVSANVGSKVNGKMMTIVVDGDDLYLEYSGLLDVLKSYQDNERIASVVQQIESNFGSAIKLNVKTVSEALAPIMESAMSSATVPGSEDNEIVNNLLKVYMDVIKDATKNPDNVKELAKSISESAETNFENLTGVDGDMYTLTINKDNMDKVLEDVENLLNNDGQKIAEDVVAYIYKVSGENALGKSEDEIKAQIPEWIQKASSEISENKDKAIEEISKTGLDTVCKINVNEGKDAKFEITMKMDSEGTAVDYTGSVEYTVGTSSISDKIPADANDITTMITTLVNMYSSQLTGADDSTTDIY